MRGVLLVTHQQNPVLSPADGLVIYFIGFNTGMQLWPRDSKVITVQMMLLNVSVADSELHQWF